MKKYIVTLVVCSFLSLLSFAQTTVSGSIRKGTTTSILEVVAKPNANINAQVGNINITFSIPNQVLTGGVNPTEASITKSTNLLNANLAPTDANNPYIIGNRAYYSYLLLQSSTTSDVPSALTANTDNLIATFTFASPYSSEIRLDDLTNNGGGPNFQMTWYVQFNQGLGDVTNYDTPFYGYYNSTDATNNAGSAPQFVTLVVKFLNFTVLKNDDKAILNWSVENEGTNTANYEIQKSLNGIDFTAITSMSPLNNGRTSNSYSYTQDNLSTIRSSGNIYFRIKQIDRDGKFVYTEIRSVRLAGKSFSASAVPNPVKDITKVTVDLVKDEVISIVVTDAVGKQVRNIQVQGVKGPNFRDINLGSLSAGSYMIKVQAGSEVEILPVVKTN